MVTKCAESVLRPIISLSSGRKKLFIHESKSVRPLRDFRIPGNFVSGLNTSGYANECARTMSVTLDRNGHKVVVCHPDHVESS